MVEGCERLRPLPQLKRLDSFPRTKAFAALQRRLERARPEKAAGEEGATLSDAMHDFVAAPSTETLASLEKGLRTRTLELAGKCKVQLRKVLSLDV